MQVKVEFGQKEWDALCRWAIEEHRPVPDQVEHIVVQRLEVRERLVDRLRTRIQDLEDEIEELRAKQERPS